MTEAWLSKMMNQYNYASVAERAALLKEGQALYDTAEEMQRAVKERAGFTRLNITLQCLAFAYMNSGLQMPSLMVQRLSTTIQQQTQQRHAIVEEASMKKRRSQKAKDVQRPQQPPKRTKVLSMEERVEDEANLILEARANVAGFGLLNRVRDAVISEMRGTVPEGNSGAMWRFLDAVEDGARKMRKRRVTRLQTRQKIAVEAISYRADIETRRVKMLKENDWEGYMNMLKQWKNERLETLLRQTDACLAGVLVGIHERRGDKEAVVLAGLTPEKVREQLKTLVHAQKEEVPQPTMLVGGHLKPYQLVGLEWLVSLYNNGVNGILADEMGLGKTISTIALFSHLVEVKRIKGPFLVVVPLATLPNWKREFEKWAPSLNVVIWDALAGPEGRPKLYREQIKTHKANVVVTTYSLTREAHGRKRSQLSHVNWKYIVVDEGHRLKNDKSKLATSLSKYKCNYRLILTGTPLQNNLGELFALLSFLLPDVFSSATSFEKWFSSPFDDEVEMKTEEKLLVVQSLHKALEPFLLRRLKKEVASELPPLLERTVMCSLSAFQERLDSTISNDGNVPLPDGTTKSISRPQDSLKKLCTHPLLLYYDRDGRLAPGMHTEFQGESLIKASGKFALLDSILFRLRALKHKVLIFDPWTRTLDLLEELLNMRSYPFLRLDGSTPATSREGLIESFSTDPDAFVFLLSTKAAGEGVNLQVASTVIIFEEAWNPQNDLQAQARAHRFGQKNTVLVMRMVTAHRSELTKAARVTSKRKMEKVVIHAGQFNNEYGPQTAMERRDSVLDALQEDKRSELVSNVPFMPSSLEIDRLVARDNDELEFYSNMRPRNTPVPLVSRGELPSWAAPEPPGMELTGLELTALDLFGAGQMGADADAAQESFGGFSFAASSKESLELPLDTCPICKEKEEREHGWVQCDGCGRWWHKACCHIRAEADLTASEWKCPDPAYCNEMPEEQELTFDMGYDDDDPLFSGGAFSLF